MTFAALTSSVHDNAPSPKLHVVLILIPQLKIMEVLSIIYTIQ